MTYCYCTLKETQGGAPGIQEWPERKLGYEECRKAKNVVQKYLPSRKCFDSN